MVSDRFRCVDDAATGILVVSCLHESPLQDGVPEWRPTAQDKSAASSTAGSSMR